MTEGLKKKPARFFFDMDGFIVDFDSVFQQHMGHIREEDQREDRWKWEDLHARCPDIYLISPKLESGFEVLNFLDERGTYEQWHILTAIPKRWAFPEVCNHKREWVLKHIPEIPVDRIRFGPYAYDKQFHCTGSRDVLIDDKIRNIQQWENRGGIGIHFQGNAAATIAQLKQRVFSEKT